MGHRNKHDGKTFELLPTCGTRYPKSLAKSVMATFFRCDCARGHPGDHAIFGTFPEDPNADKMGKIRWPRTRAQTYER